MKVRKERLKLGISQEELGFRTGLDRTYISGIERGERNPTLVNIGRIAKGLKIELPELFSFGSP
jgi:transcriptional regulator with XRE-family HTH domain